MIDDIDWAIQQSVHKKRGMSKKLAEILGCSQQVLLNKVNPEVESNHLHVKELFKIVEATGDITPFEIMLEKLGYRVVKEQVKPEPVLQAMLKSVKEHGDVADAITRALEDGEIDEQEVRIIMSEIREGQHALEGLEHAIKQHAGGQND